MKKPKISKQKQIEIDRMLEEFKAKSERDKQASNEEYEMHKKRYPNGLLKYTGESTVYDITPLANKLGWELVNEFVTRLQERSKQRNRGTNKTKDNAQARFLVAKEIFEILEEKGETFPIKKDRLESLVNPIWSKRTTIKAVKKDTLNTYQRDYIEDKKKKG